jgi:hypothetical protein
MGLVGFFLGFMSISMPGPKLTDLCDAPGDFSGVFVEGDFNLREPSSPMPITLNLGVEDFEISIILLIMLK